MLIKRKTYKKLQARIDRLEQEKHMLITSPRSRGAVRIRKAYRYRCQWERAVFFGTPTKQFTGETGGIRTVIGSKEEAQ
jgi:hypothetical protein